MKHKNEKNLKRIRRHVKIRARVFGTENKPRLCVFKSNVATYGQVINDDKSVTIAASNSLLVKGKNKTEKAFEAGKAIAKDSVTKGVKRVVFDRGGFKYTGRVKAFARGAREAGLEF